MDMSTVQRMLLDVRKVTDAIGTHVYVLGRRSGKGLMQMEMIAEEVDRLASGEVRPRHRQSATIVHLSTCWEAARNFERKLIERLNRDHPYVWCGNSPDGCRITIEGLDSDDESFVTRIIFGTVKSPMQGISGVTLLIADELPGPLDGLPRMFEERRVVFRTKDESGDRRPGVMVIGMANCDVNPMLGRDEVVRLDCW